MFLRLCYHPATTRHNIVQAFLLAQSTVYFCSRITSAFVILSKFSCDLRIHDVIVSSNNSLERQRGLLFKVYNLVILHKAKLKLNLQRIMKDEIDCACEFLYLNIRSSQEEVLIRERLDLFRRALRKSLVERFSDHWYPDKPMKGSGFRCINIDKDSKIVDPLLVKAAAVCNISKDILLSTFCSGLALWIDPGDVCYRTGISSNVISLYKSANVESIQLPLLHQPHLLSSLLHGRLQPSNLISYTSNSNKPINHNILQQYENFTRYYWTSANYVVPKQITEVY